MVFGLGGKKLDLDKDGKRDALMAAFAEIQDGTLGKPITEAGFIDGVSGEKGKANVHVKLPSMAWRGRDELVAAVEQRAQDVMGDVEVVMHVDSDVKPAAGDRFDKQTLDGVRNVVLVASGKGGVGKSTIATNLAVALGERGCRVGLLDADVYGPSGTMPGDEPDRPKIVPLERHGIKLMSIGFLVDTSTPMVWRGPMIASACMQLFKDVGWGELDYLIVDLPPGTGDIHLTISQQVLVAGSVVVSTPQDVALADVVRAKNMFDKVSIPTIGIIENMSYFICDGCDKRHEIFTHGGARRAAEKLSVSFLGEVPLEPGVRAGGDEGTPAVLTHPQSASSKAFLELADTVATELAITAIENAADDGGAGPTIRISGGGGGKKKGGLPILN
jgi:ATP-binding protein involved in chromosome partitioning